ncbi:MAG: pseudouridine synthase [Bacillota bacterium]|nr:pseudouridine synthase [Bacillota bacterium]HHU62184.1 rRNA pseudouridine synthase [Natronincola sp.]
MEERLQKVMAHAGVDSRRACEEIIREGRVTVNGEVAHLGLKVNPQEDIILIDGKPLGGTEQKRYLILNKPFGFITTVNDQFGRKDVLDLVSDIPERIYPVGRLDFDSEGLVFLTNDGSLAHKVMHPSFEIPKTYSVVLEGKITMDSVYRLRTGIILEDGRTAPAKVKLLETSNSESRFHLTIHEGRNRQVRRMCSKIGHEVKRLIRVGIGPLELGNLPSGKYRNLTKEEIRLLKQAVDS